MLLTLLILSSIGLVAAADLSLFSKNNYSLINIINGNILIISNNIASTHIAVQLKDLGKSFTLVEKSSILGGHMHTYIDPMTSTPVEFRVHSFSHTLDIPGRTRIPPDGTCFRAGCNGAMQPRTHSVRLIARDSH